MVSLSDVLAEWVEVVGLTMHASVNCLHNLISGKMEHTCTTCSPTWLLSANQTRSTQSGACKKKNSPHRAEPGCSDVDAHVRSAWLIVWGSAEACILRVGRRKTLHHRDKGTK